MLRILGLNKLTGVGSWCSMSFNNWELEKKKKKSWFFINYACVFESRSPHQHFQTSLVTYMNLKYLNSKIFKYLIEKKLIYC